jgi:hypothetical protein
MIEGIRKLYEVGFINYDDRWTPNSPQVNRLGELFGVDTSTYEGVAKVADYVFDTYNELDQYCTVERRYEMSFERSFERVELRVREREVVRPKGTQTTGEYYGVVDLLRCDVPDIGEFYVVRSMTSDETGARSVTMRSFLGKASAEYNYEAEVRELRRKARVASRSFSRIGRYVRSG